MSLEVAGKFPGRHNEQEAENIQTCRATANSCDSIVKVVKIKMELL
jgi:hypothetical protein